MSKEKLFVKFIRAKAKTSYHKHKKEECFVCGKRSELELHHNIPLAEVVNGYLKSHNIKNPSNDLELREQILTECSYEIFGELITLCKMHHKAVHTLFGRTYNNKTSIKVKKYLERQKEKLTHGE